MSQPGIEALTRQLEMGNAEGVVPFMHGKFLEERLETLDLIKAQNQANRQTDSNTPELQITSSTVSPGRSYERIHLLPGGPGNLLGGKPLYVGCTDIKTLSRCDGLGESIPESRNSVDLRALTDSLENGDGKRAAGLLSPLALEERVRVFNQVKDMNQEDLNQGRTEARLDVNIKATKVGTNEISVRRSLPGTHNFFSGGSMVYGESLSVRTGQRKVLDL